MTVVCVYMYEITRNVRFCSHGAHSYIETVKGGDIEETILYPLPFSAWLSLTI